MTARVRSVATFLACLAVVILVGIAGRAMFARGVDLLAWLWLGAWLGLIGCGLAVWCRRESAQNGPPTHPSTSER